MPAPPRRTLADLFADRPAQPGGIAGTAPGNDGTWSDHPLWSLLRSARLRLETGGVRADIRPEVRDLHGRTISISGFIRPAGFVAIAEGFGAFERFVLSRYSPDCPYCPAAGPTESIAVTCREPIAPTSAMVTLEGELAVQDRMDRGAFYQLADAVLVS